QRAPASAASVPPSDAKTMFPLMLDVTALPIFVIGGGGVAGRVIALDEHGAAHVHVFSENPTPDLTGVSGARLQQRWPASEDFASLRPRLVFISDVDDETAARFRGLAQAVGALVH